MQILCILWGALFSSTLMMLLALVLTRPPDAQPTPILLPVLGAVGLGSAAFSVIVPKLQFRAALRAYQFPTRQIEDPSSLPGSGKMLRVPVDQSAVLSSVLTRFQTPFILGMAMSESVALYGFVLGFTGFPLMVCMPFFLVSWALMAMRFPSPKAILNEAQAVTGIRFDLD